MHTELETLKTNSEIQSHENESTENVRLNGEENIQTIHEDNPDTNTGNQEEDTGSALIDIQEEESKSSPTKVSKSWWLNWPRS